jgi:hypothetical protein
VTIYGFRQVYRRSFPAGAFDEALVIHNYTGDSADTTYGITLLTESGKIAFIHPYQSHTVIQQKADQINALFLDAVPAPDISLTFIGFSWSLYFRLLLLVAGWLVVLYRSRNSVSKSALVPAGQPSFRRYAWRWFRNNLLVRVFFYFIILIIMLSGCTQQYSLQTDLAMGCYSILATVKGFFGWQGFWVCLFPLLTLLMLKSLAHRHMLGQANIRVSAWWILAPLLAAPLFLVTPLSSYLSCEDCFSFKYLLAGLFAFDSLLMTGLVVYFLILGLIQWLALRKTLPGSWGWVVMPLVNAMLVVPVMMGYVAFINASGRQLNSLQRQVSIRTMSLYLPALLILLTILLSEIIPALYISWAVKRNKPVMSIE